MKLGNFLGKLKGREKEEPKQFLALVLTDEVVQAAVWSVLEEKTEIIAIGTPVEWDGDTGTTSELITAVDATISNAVEGLSQEPNEVILGISHSWTDKDGVLGVKREFINKIRKELDLKALGYVTITDSILSYLKMQEGTPTTGVLIQVSRDELELVLVRLGHIEAIETIGRGDDVVEDVTEGIARFKIMENLPSRIILFNSMHNLEDIIQNLLSVNWQTQFNFLHLPKIEALSQDVTIRALSVAGGSEVAKSLGFAVSESVPAGPGLAGPDDLPARPGPNGDPQPEPALLTAEEIGFINPKDEPSSPITTKPPFVMPKLKLPSVVFPTLKFNLSFPKPLWWFLGGGFVLLVVLVFWLIWILPKATVIISVVPKEIDKEVELTLSGTDTSINFADMIVPASIELITESGEKLIETTGKKIVGNSTKGEVTIYNRTSTVKTLAKGVTFFAGSLKFTLDSETMVASGSSSNDYVGKSTGSITSSSIGAEYNLPPGTEFTIASFGKDSYVAKNDAALTGGTSEEVQVVGKDDQKILVKELTTKLLESIKNKSSQDRTPGIGIYLIDNSVKVDDASYSAKIGETAKTLTAKLTIKVSLLRYKTDDVTTLVNSSIDQAVPSGYIRADLPSTVELSASTVDDSGTTVRGSAKVKVALLPVVDSSHIQSLIKGKQASSLENILVSSVPGYVRTEIVVNPRWIPTRLKSIPLNPNNIIIQIASSL
ncbi:hypothetical protein COT87_01540 [Candidatus Collierbacteria bacterium CG10_big_fil_rev_8_21_14_0_10_44_9]|uniref:Baseplate protein J-like domain-containing protein n=1 Tax=Candidatus Collierbacteria bacterium CG10_big_fil_rev_8_21_14_0_10_44_9 TaxID=1974535 RepID=A0A2H0VIX9_9BACT|nr:MAG: hypothetical protein COT87_01540 [Candidatus Collierbacteria bacterium CG10_big_fil_rev_8_21_14_0_10_44_9]